MSWARPTIPNTTTTSYLHISNCTFTHITALDMCTLPHTACIDSSCTVVVLDFITTVSTRLSPQVFTPAFALMAALAIKE